MYIRIYIYIYIYIIYIYTHKDTKKLYKIVADDYNLSVILVQL